jgi:hypothetical protein
MWTTVFGAVALFAAAFAVTAYVMREQDKRRAVIYPQGEHVTLSDPDDAVIPLRGRPSIRAKSDLTHDAG